MRPCAPLLKRRGNVPDSCRDGTARCRTCTSSAVVEAARAAQWRAVLERWREWPMLSGCRLSVVCGRVDVGDAHVCVTQTQRRRQRRVCVCMCVCVCNMCERAGVCHGVPSDGTHLSTSARARTSCVYVWDPGADSGTVARAGAARSQKKNIRRARRKGRGRPWFRVRANERAARKLRCVAVAGRLRGKIRSEPDRTDAREKNVRGSARGASARGRGGVQLASYAHPPPTARPIGAPQSPRIAMMRAAAASARAPSARARDGLRGARRAAVRAVAQPPKQRPPADRTVQVSAAGAPARCACVRCGP